MAKKDDKTKKEDETGEARGFTWEEFMELPEQTLVERLRPTDEFVDQYRQDAMDLARLALGGRQRGGDGGVRMGTGASAAITPTAEPFNPWSIETPELPVEELPVEGLPMEDEFEDLTAADLDLEDEEAKDYDTLKKILGAGAALALLGLGAKALKGRGVKKAATDAPTGATKASTPKIDPEFGTASRATPEDRARQLLEGGTERQLLEGGTERQLLEGGTERQLLEGGVEAPTGALAAGQPDLEEVSNLLETVNTLERAEGGPQHMAFELKPRQLAPAELAELESGLTEVAGISGSAATERPALTGTERPALTGTERRLLPPGPDSVEDLGPLRQELQGILDRISNDKPLSKSQMNRVKEIRNMLHPEASGLKRMQWLVQDEQLPKRKKKGRKDAD